MIPVKTVRCPGCGLPEVSRIGDVYVDARWPLFRCHRCNVDFAIPIKHLENREDTDERR